MLYQCSKFFERFSLRLDWPLDNGEQQNTHTHTQKSWYFQKKTNKTKKELGIQFSSEPEFH